MEKQVFNLGEVGLVRYDRTLKDVPYMDEPLEPLLEENSFYIPLI